VNHDYSAVLATAHLVHERKHEGAAAVHLFAAGRGRPWATSPKRNMRWRPCCRKTRSQHLPASFIKSWNKSNRASASNGGLAESASDGDISFSSERAISGRGRAPYPANRQEKIEESQIAEAEAAPDPTCKDCGTTGVVETTGASSSGSQFELSGKNDPGVTFRVTVDEVALFFTATDRGKSVTNLTAPDVEIRDNTHLRAPSSDSVVSPSSLCDLVSSSIPATPSETVLF